MEKKNEIRKTEDLPKIFGEKDIMYYWNVLKIPMILSVLVGSLFLLDGRGWGFTYGVFGIGLVYSVYILYKKGSRQYSEFAFFGGFFGFLFGFCAYTANFISEFTVQSFFAIIYLTFLLIVISCVLSFILRFALRFLKV